MTRRRRIVLGLLALGSAGLLVLAGGAWWIFHYDPFTASYEESCAVCHGERLEGTPLARPLVGIDLLHGDSLEDLERSIREGFPQQGMPAWGETLDETEIRRLAIYVAEQREGREFRDFKVHEPVGIPDGPVASELHTFRVEPVAQGLDPLPYSIAPLPDGRILLAEKMRGLRLVGADGSVSPPVEGAPRAYDDGVEIYSLQLSLGWLLDVAPHPDYADNGWIYLHHTDRCKDCNTLSNRSPLPVSMNRVVRGRIRDGAWVDEQIVWSTDVANYTATTDMAAGGRLAFDAAGHLFLSIGMKGPTNHHGIQDLSRPYGKIHRVHDDGRVPADNPYVGDPDALDTIWTYGHRSPQGLEFAPRTGRLWSTEMGPRGGDELNWLRPGRNYGWPLHSKGLDYDGTPVEYGKDLGIEFDLADIEQPRVDWTPAIAVSSFVLYEGDAFPRWRGHALVGSLKARQLLRVPLDGEHAFEPETLLSGLGRIRDVEVAPDGTVLLLIEHGDGGQILRLVP